MSATKRYPKAARTTALIACGMIVLGFVQAPAFFFFAAWLLFVALILALGPDNKQVVQYRIDPSPMRDGDVMPIKPVY